MERRPDFCPRDVFGFCWISVWNAGDCGGVAKEAKGRAQCPSDPAEAERRKEAARLHAIDEAMKHRPLGPVDPKEIPY